MSPRDALLSNPDGTALDPADLVSATFSIGVEEVERARVVARAIGAVLERDGLSVLALGVTARLTLPNGVGSKDAADAASALLLAIETSGRPVRALGAAPFDGSAAATFTLAEVTVIDDGSAPFALVVARRDEGLALDDRFPFGGHDAPTLPGETPPSSFTLTSVHSHDAYRRRVADAVAAIERGELQKVVLAREVAVRADGPFARSDLVRRLRQLHPGCTTFSIDGFLGASPELLLRREGNSVLSQPLAGTVPRSGDPDADEMLARSLFASAKERAEHAFVVEAIIAALDAAGGDVTFEAEPHLMELRNVSHLATVITAMFAAAPSILDLVGIIHPTPAIAGVPRDAAIAYLARVEGLDRDRYAGPVGWFDGGGDGEFWLGLRSAIVAGDHARLIAGAGIVEGSDPDAELAETQLKLQALLAAAVRP